MASVLIAMHKRAGMATERSGEKNDRRTLQQK